jgi:ADP-heptose:LPS heptosyltransferase
LAPGAQHATKCWPAAHWRALAHRLAAEGKIVAGTGAAHERALLDGAPVIDAFGAPLDVTAALLARAKVVVANDSGLLHLASAAGAPVVGLYGPTVRALGFHPYQARGTVLERPLPCRPCSAHGGAACPRGHHRCLADITPDHVLAAIAAA